MQPGVFDIAGLFAALDEQRKARGLSWQGATKEINAIFGGVETARPISPSTVKGTGERAVVEGDGVLQMLLWLDRCPEDFVTGYGPVPPEARLPRPGRDRILRWNPPALFAAVQEKREALGLTWNDVADQVGCRANNLTGLAKAQRVALPDVMRIVLWVGRPAAAFTRASEA